MVTKWPHLSILVINKQVPHALIVQVGDLETVSVVYLLWLEDGVQVLHGDDGFRSLGIGFELHN